ncbi:hypothetical protein HZU77_015570 [Neisseriaceae bacterium TC5R-5]|nr:hypothetical protein [Neisseriaceae bacterium TC5R-5]
MTYCELDHHDPATVGPIHANERAPEQNVDTLLEREPTWSADLQEAVLAVLPPDSYYQQEEEA